MYRTYLNKTLEREELKSRNKYAPDGVRYCNGFCQDFSSIDEFSRSKTAIKMICNKCRNLINLGKRQVASGKITLEDFKENPNIVYGIDGEITSYKVCPSCHENKPDTQYYINKGKCKACIAIINSKRDKNIDKYIKDIETLKTNFHKLHQFVSNIPKAKLAYVISHFKIGRKASDTKPRMVHNIVEHFKRLADPRICLGGCGFSLQEEFSTCGDCQKKVDKEKESNHVKPVDFEDTLDDILENLEHVEDHHYNRPQMFKIARKLGIKGITQNTKKKPLLQKINEFLQQREEKQETEEKKLLIPPSEKCTKLELNCFAVSARQEDGFINATQLCKAGGKQFREWKRLESTKNIVQVLESDVGIPTSQLIEVKKGNTSKFSQGSWIHPDLAVQLAQWISPSFALQVSRWVRELAVTGQVVVGQEKTNQQIISLQNLLQKEREKVKKIQKKHKTILQRRSYHKFEKGPILYIISDSDSTSQKYKIGIDDVDVNVRLQQHRTSVPSLQLEYLVYTNQNSLIESAILERYKSERKPYLNHEWIFEVKVGTLIDSVETMLHFLGTDYTVNQELEKYNKC